jgi:hypothetical protein
MDKPFLVLAACYSLLVTRPALGQIGLAPGECEDFFVQDPIGITSLEGAGYTENGAKVTILFSLGRSAVIKWEPKARPISESDVRLYAGRNGIDLSDGVSPKNAWYANRTTPLKEFSDPANTIHMLIFPGPSDKNSIGWVVVLDRNGTDFLGGHNASDRTVSWLKETLPDFTAKESKILTLPLGKTRTEETAFISKLLTAEINSRMQPSPVPGVQPYLGPDRMNKGDQPEALEHNQVALRMNGAHQLQSGTATKIGAFGYLMIFSFKDNKIVAVDYDSHGYTGVFWYADVAAITKINGINWASCVPVPEGERWVDPVRRTSKGDPNNPPKAFDLIKEFYDPSHKDIHVILGRLGDPRQGNQYPQLYRTLIRIENAEGRAMRENSVPVCIPAPLVSRLT